MALPGVTSYKVNMRLTLTMIAVALCLTACGVKPRNLSSPDTGKPDTFPHTYPAPQILDK